MIFPEGVGESVGEGVEEVGCVGCAEGDGEGFGGEG